MTKTTNEKHKWLFCIVDVEGNDHYVDVEGREAHEEYYIGTMAEAALEAERRATLWWPEASSRGRGLVLLKGPLGESPGGSRRRSMTHRLHAGRECNETDCHWLAAKRGAPRENRGPGDYECTGKEKYWSDCPRALRARLARDERR